MCFWWTNNKIKLNNNLDIMSTVVNKNVKLDTKIDVPTNFVGLIYYNDKYLFTLQSGEYKFQGDTFYKVVEKNERRNRNIKKPSFNFNIHYINISRQKIETSIYIQVAFKQKECYVMSCIYEIDNPTKFADEILATWYKTTNKRTEKLIKELFGEFCFEFLRKRLKKNIDISSQLQETASKHFKSFGIKICEIQLRKHSENNTANFFDITDNQNDINSANHKNFYNNSNNQSYGNADTFNQSLTFPQKQNNTINNQTNKKYCPNCQAEQIIDADYCSRCGYKF